MNDYSLPNGVYQHYKGNRYEVLGVGKHTETLEELVMYRSIDGSGALWVRPLRMFVEEIEVNGVRGPRFKLLERKDGREFAVYEGN